MRQLDLPPSWRSRALVIANVDDPVAWFSEEELIVARSFRLRQRREQWMLSRVAAKELARQRGDRRPVLEIALDRSPTLSFSHSRGFAAAAMSDAPVGIDVEALRTIDERAAHLFLSSEEEEAMRSCTIADRLLHFWCAKEAAWKQLGGAVVTLKQVPLRLLGATDRGLHFDRADTWSTAEIVVALTN